MAFDPTVIQQAFPAYQTDKIIGIFTGSFTVPAPVFPATQYTENTQSSGFGDTCLTQCIFRSDGGDWQDDGNQISGGVLQVLSFTRNGSIGVKAANADGSSHAIDYKIVAIAKKNQGTLTPVATNENIQFSSADNYLKYTLEDIQPLVLSGLGPSTYTVTHSLGYIPTVRAGYEINSNSEIWNGGNLIGMGSTPDLIPQIQITTSQVSFIIDSFTAQTVNIHYRIYLDA